MLDEPAPAICSTRIGADADEDAEMQMDNQNRRALLALGPTYESENALAFKLEEEGE
jgi:hypothetical protein